jgi:protein TonB
MTDVHPIDGSLPEDLRALDEELSAIRYEERPSFQPELRAELARVWAEEPVVRRAPVWRRLAAAAVAALLVGGAAVPSARASFVRLFDGIAVAPADGLPGTLPSQPVRSGTPPVSPPVVEIDVPLEEASGGAPISDAAATPGGEPIMIAPEMIDREESEQILQAAYPMHLQRRGVGGTVWLRLWVDDVGRASAAQVARSSGVPELDRVAVRVAPRFRFTPAMQDGRGAGTWIEFPVLFEPDPDRVERVLRPVVDPLSLPTVGREEWWQFRDPLDLQALPPRAEIGAAERSEVEHAAAELEATLSRADLLDGYGPAGAILSGEAPEGVPPTEWRAAVGDVFEDAVRDGTETPAAMLALGRIRLRQGLRGEARAHFERGLQAALRDPGAGSPWLIAELHHERGSLLRERWLGASGVGRVYSQAFPDGACSAARSSGGADSGFASVDRLVAWNYLCPGEMSEVFRRGFEAGASGVAGDLTLMMASYRSALEAYPAHIGANTDLLLTLAQEQRWEDVLSGARRFVRTSGAHPDGLLLAGLALHRLGRSDEAAEHFEAALSRMGDSDADAMRDVTVLLGDAEARRYMALSGAERRSWEVSYWAARDGAPSTAVNERWVEHMARTSYARLRFGGLFGDAAEVWVRFGWPNRIHIVDDGTGRLTEFWDYGSGPDITFVRWVSAERTDLTPEGRAYVDDLGKIFPPQ